MYAIKCTLARHAPFNRVAFLKLEVFRDCRHPSRRAKSCRKTRMKRMPHILYNAGKYKRLYGSPQVQITRFTFLLRRHTASTACISLP